MLKSFRKHYLLVAVLMVTVLLTGCFGASKDEEFKLDITVTLDGGEGKVEDVALLVGTKSVTVAKDGKAAATVAEGSVAVKATLDGYVSYDKTITVKEDSTLAIELKAVEDPIEEPTAEDAVKVVEAVDVKTITSFAALTDVDALFVVAEEAIDELDDEEVADALNKRLADKQDEIDKVLDAYLKAVKDAKNQMDFFAALNNFWAVDAQYSAIYQDLYDNKYDVYEIQEKVVEAAPSQQSLVPAFKAAIESGNLFELSAVLETYAQDIDRVIYFDSEYINEYMTALEDEANLDLGKIQTAIELVNLNAATEAVEEAETKFDRGLAESARALVADLHDKTQEAEKKELNADLDKLVALLDVSEAPDADALVVALKALAKSSKDFMDEDDIHAERKAAYFKAMNADDVSPAQRKNAAAIATIIGDENDTLDSTPVKFTAKLASEEPWNINDDAPKADDFTITAINDLGEEIAGTLTDLEVRNTKTNKVVDDADFAEIGVVVVAIKGNVGEKEFTTNTVSINVIADPTTENSTLTADKEKYVAGDKITLTLTVGYGEDEEKDEDLVLTTLNGTYAAEVALNGKSQNLNVAFINGKATFEVEARHKGNAVTVTIPELKEDGGSPLTVAVAADDIDIVAGKASKLTADLVTGTGSDPDEITLKVTDGWNPITDFGTKTANITFTPAKPAAASVPDEDGNVNVDFDADGEGTISLEGTDDWDAPAPDAMGTFTITIDDLVATVERK